MLFNPRHKATFVTDPSVSLLAAIRNLIGLPADDSSGGTLVTSIEQAGLAISTIEEAGHGRGSDIVLGRFLIEDLPAAPPLFALGVQISSKYLWNPRFHLWLPRRGEPAVFVPATLAPSVCFHVLDGSLVVHDHMPFASLADRERGILAAHDALCASAEG